MTLFVTTTNSLCIKERLDSDLYPFYMSPTIGIFDRLFYLLGRKEYPYHNEPLVYHLFHLVHKY